MEKRTTEESHDKSVWTTDSQTSLHHPLTEKEKENVAFSRHTAQKSLATHGQGAIDSQQTSVPLETFIPFLGNPPFLLSQHSKGPHISIDDVCPNICFKALPVTVPGPVVPKSPKKMDRVESVTVSSSIETQGPPPTLSLGRTKNTIVSKPLEVDQAYGPPYIHPDDYLIGPHSAIYQPFLSLEQANKEIEAKTLVHGPLRIRHTRHMEGYVTCDALNDDVIIHNLIDRNRGLEGDIVAVRLKSLRKKGKKPTKRKGVFKKVSILHYDTMEDQLKKQDNDDDNDDDNNDNNDNDNNDNDGNDGNDGNDDKENTHKYYGEVVAILQRLGTTLHTG
ncbi:hypothetical protein BDF14DRAFT_145600 [Spinellus fusiger]|nr:hypothetical protein BDF14DRAFT_145600 [Spinellus fusiger]